MKLEKTASGSKKVTISKAEWIHIGRQAGWVRGTPPEAEPTTQEYSEFENTHNKKMEEFRKKAIEIAAKLPTPYKMVARNFTTRGLNQKQALKSTFYSIQDENGQDVNFPEDSVYGKTIIRNIDPEIVFEAFKTFILDKKYNRPNREEIFNKSQDPRRFEL